MLRGEAGWERRLDMSADAVFASFLAVPLALPALLARGEAQRQLAALAPNAPPSPEAAALAVTVGVTMLVSWGFCLVVLGRVAAQTQAGWRVSPLIVGFNWSRLAVNLLGAVLVGAALALRSVPLGGVAALVVLGVAIWCDYALGRRALGFAPGRAAALVGGLFLARFLAVFVVGAMLNPLLR